MPSRRRRSRSQPADVLLDRRGRPVTPWKWLTFPVYFALAFGLFVGFNLGLLAVRRYGGQPRVEQVLAFAFAVLFSFALAQFVTRPFAEMMLRRRAKQ